MPFLGHWPVPQAVPVIMMLAENRLKTIQDRQESICRARGINRLDLPLYTLCTSYSIADPAWQTVSHVSTSSRCGSSPIR